MKRIKNTLLLLAFSLFITNVAFGNAVTQDPKTVKDPKTITQNQQVFVMNVSTDRWIELMKLTPFIEKPDAFLAEVQKQEKLFYTEKLKHVPIDPDANKPYIVKSGRSLLKPFNNQNVVSTVPPLQTDQATIMYMLNTLTALNSDGKKLTQSEQALLVVYGISCVREDVPAEAVSDYIQYMVYNQNRPIDIVKNDLLKFPDFYRQNMLANK